MKVIVTLLIGLVIGIGLGNLNGDQATLHDCATKGKATMKGGGTIICSVNKSE
jgi:hypothetical protein